MNRNIIIIAVFICILIVMGLALAYTVMHLSQYSSIKENVLIALIVALSAIITITGSVLTNRLVANEQLRNEKEMEFLRIKREFYHEFLGQFLMQMAYHNQRLLWTDESKENEIKFLINKVRLPLYASKELIEHFAKI